MKKEANQSVGLLRFQGRVSSEYNHPAFLEAISDCEGLLQSPACELLHEGRNRVGVVLLPRKDGGKADIVIKEFRPQGVNRLKSIFLPGKASKAWVGAHALLERAIGTPFPVAFLELRRKFSLERSYYLSERIEGVEEIRFLFRNLPPEELQVLLNSLARHLSACHRRGILHRDLSDGNILVKKNHQKNYQFFLIDTNRVRVTRRINLLRRVKNLVRLGVPPWTQRGFLSQYLGGRSVKRDLWLWYCLNKRIYSWYIEMKKKLRLRRLARKLRIQ